jgi:two-component system NtrC family response regulator
MANVLIIDDDEGMCFALSEMIRHLGHKSTCVHTLTQGVQTAFSESFDVVYLDVMLPDGNGLDVLPKIQAAPSKPEVIIITSRGDPDGAELAIKNGAWDYIQKPSSLKAMTLPLLRALQYRQDTKDEKPPVVLKREGIIGNSSQVKACLELLAQAASSDANVLVTGETGTGKELMASAIHENSPRHKNNFVVVDCAGLPATLVESMLFGHEKGAYTGADRARTGLIKHADGGTLFLDEVGELPFLIQKTFLRTLQERRFRPLGSRQEIASDFRLITATNRDLDEMVKQAWFREDLLFRIRSFTLDLPPLRDRKGDIKELSLFHVARLCDNYGIGTKGFSPEFIEALETYTWPGNVRELFNVLERALISAKNDPTLFPKHLPVDIRVNIAQSSLPQEAQEQKNQGIVDSKIALSPLREYRMNLEKKYIQDLMELTEGRIKKACQISGLSRSRLYALMKKYSISKPG